MTTNLVQFLRDRYDEEAALAASGETWSAFDESTQGTRRVDVDHSFERVVACTRAWRGEHIARHDPARTLREIEAKRQVLKEYTKAAETMEELAVRRERLKASGQDVFMTEMERASAIHKRDVLHGVLQILALPYSDHPAYRQEWRP